MIRNTGYIGKTVFSGILLPDVTPAIIDEELYKFANSEIDRPKVRNGRPKQLYLLRNHAYCAICGKPLVGHCLNKKYRYYQCNSARPFETSPKRCVARYIRAGELEDIVWRKTREVLKAPKLILTKIQNEIVDINNKTSQNNLNNEITKLQKNLGNYELRRSNLLEAMELGEFEKNEILDRLSNIKRLRHEDEVKLSDLLKTRENLASLAGAKIKLGQIYDRVLENLQYATPEIKMLALDALELKVYAKGLNDVEIQGVIPLELALPTTAQTSASLRACSFPCLPGG